MLRKLIVHRRSIFPVPDAGWLVRYRFRSPEGLHRHLRLGNGFVVGQPAPRHRVARAIVEVEFDGGTTLLLHGQVRSRSDRGAIIEVPLARSVRWMGEIEGAQRREKRIACDLFVEVKPPGGDAWLCRALDVSPHGLRLAAGAMDLGVAGDRMELTLLAADNRVPPVAAAARLSWAGMREAGLELTAAVGIEGLLGVLAERWSAVPVVDHDTICECGRPSQKAS